VWLWNLEIGRKAYQDLQPVWQYIQGHYQLRTLLGGREWGYSIYEPGTCAARTSGSARNGSMSGSGLRAWRRLTPVSHMSVKTLVCGV
jgi:hypothetical protein